MTRTTIFPLAFQVPPCCSRLLRRDSPMSTSTLPHPAPPPYPLRHLLETYTTSHPLRSPSPLPASSRVDPKLTQRLPPPASINPFLWTIRTWIIFARFIVVKGVHIAWSLIKHFLWGPARRSWGYRMTFVRVSG